MRYRFTLDQLEVTTGRKVNALHIVGGGSQNGVLNQFTADAIDREVRAGPVEAAAIGNVLVQAEAFGELRGQAQMREVVKRSFSVEVFQPKAQVEWVEPYERYKEVAPKRVRAG